MVKDMRKTVDKVLFCLENNIGGFVSGTYIANNIGVSRNAIWKAVNELKSSGYIIESVSNKGYKLSERNDIVSAEGIKSYLEPVFGDTLDNIFVFDSVDSTNNRAKELAIKGAEHGTCIVACRQDGGRGRMDHIFYSPIGGIYMSIVLRPEKIHFSDHNVITSYIGISVCKSIERLTGQSPYIQGINDLYLDGRKICGILIESGSEFDSNTLQWLVAGIGINFDSNVKQFPKELRDKAGSLFKPGKTNISKNQLIAKVLENIYAITDADEKTVMKSFKELSKA